MSLIPTHSSDHSINSTARHAVHKHLQIYTRLWALVLCLLAGAGTLLAAPPADGPVALVGQGYGWTEVQSLVKYVMDRELPGVIHEAFEGRLEPEEFDRFRAVEVAGDLEDPYTTEESHRIEEYVRGGGTLILIRQAPKSFYISSDGQADRGASYLFGRSYYMRESPRSSVFNAEASLLKGAFEATPDPFWLTGNVMLKSPEWNNLIGDGDYILVGHLPVEEGNVYFLGSELFRVLSQAKSEHLEQESEGWIRILKNALSPPEKME